MARDAGWLSMALYVLVVDRDAIGIDRVFAR
jgi:hypothetical protein